MNKNIAAVYRNTFITRTGIHSAGPNKKKLEAAKFLFKLLDKRVAYFFNWQLFFQRYLNFFYFSSQM